MGPGSLVFVQQLCIGVLGRVADCRVVRLGQHLESVTPQPLRVKVLQEPPPACLTLWQRATEAMPASRCSTIPLHHTIDYLFLFCKHKAICAITFKL